MDSLTLELSELVVDTFDVVASDPVRTPIGGMKTYEPGCTTPELCPITVGVA